MLPICQVPAARCRRTWAALRRRTTPCSSQAGRTSQRRWGRCRRRRATCRFRRCKWRLTLATQAPGPCSRTRGRHRTATLGRTSRSRGRLTSSSSSTSSRTRTRRRRRPGPRPCQTAARRKASCHSILDIIAATHRLSCSAIWNASRQIPQIDLTPARPSADTYSLDLSMYCYCRRLQSAADVGCGAAAGARRRLRAAGAQHATPQHNVRL